MLLPHRVGDLPLAGHDPVRLKSSLAEILSKAVESYRKALETPESKSIWPWLLSGQSGPPLWATALSDTRKIEAAVKEIADNLTTGKREPDDLKFSLAHELASYFEIVTGSASTFSNNEDAKTKRPAFEQFVVLALTESHISLPIKKVKRTARSGSALSSAML